MNISRLPYPLRSPQTPVQSMLANRRTGTGPEVRLRSELHRVGLRFRKDFPIRADGRSIRPDVVFTRARLAVFVDGCFWHSCPLHGHEPKSNQGYWIPKLEGTVNRDRITNDALRRAGWEVVRIWEHVPLSQAVAQISLLLRK